MTFIQKLESAIATNNSLLCIGLDPVMDKLPKHLLETDDPFLEFNKSIINTTHNLVCAFKPQIAHYEAEGAKGLETLQKTIDYIKSAYPSIPIILDAKRGDIGSTSDEYAKAAFDVLGVDAITVNPYLGGDALEPFLKRVNKGVIILCRTSNPGASDFQDLQVGNEPLYVQVAKKIVEWNKQYTNCLMVIGATWPEQLKTVREIAPDMFFLVPGIGTQGGDVEKTLQAGLRPDKSGLIIHSSRGILYASSEPDFAEIAREKAEELRNQINTYR